MSGIKCDCGAEYSVRELHYPMSDKDSFDCYVCGIELDSWDGSTIPSFTLIIDPRAKELGLDNFAQTLGGDIDGKPFTVCVASHVDRYEFRVFFGQNLHEPYRLCITKEDYADGVRAGNFDDRELFRLAEFARDDFIRLYKETLNA